jgi:hypothetical protein
MSSFLEDLVMGVLNSRMAFSLALGVTTLAAAPALQAATITWNGGAGDYDYGNGANWGGGQAPLSNDYSDTAIFASTGTPGTVTEVTPLHTFSYTSSTTTTVMLKGMNFTTAGWTIGFGLSEVTNLNSAGAGINTFAGGTINVHAASTWTVDTGNTLFSSSSGSLYERNFKLTLDGGGTLHVANAIGGYGGTPSASTWGIHITDGSTLRIDSSSPYSSGAAGAAFIGDTTGKLELKSTVANAQNLIGTRIYDETGLGLSVTDIGGGYVQIAAVPEPATVGVIGLCLAAATLRRRRRARV